MAMRSKRDVDIHALGERQHFLNRFLAAYPGLPVAAVTSTEKMRPYVIDADKVRLHAFNCRVCLGQIFGKYGDRQAVLHTVDLLQHGFVVRLFGHRQHRAENFLISNHHILRNLRKNRVFDIKATLQCRVRDTQIAITSSSVWRRCWSWRRTI